ncbi:MAG: hypothetical protein AAF969_02855, partial [Bacteroidota bacterium]
VIFALSFFFVLCSCNSSSESEDYVPLQDGIEKWELVRMTGSLINSETTGDEMSWQEYYLLNPDGSFFKSRERDGVITQATGTHIIVQEGQQEYFELTYLTGEELIASCFANGKEVLSLRNEILYGSWNACDGPGLEYRLVD